MRAKNPRFSMHLPTISAGFSILVTLLMFGADTTIFSLIASCLILVLTAACAAAYADMRATYIVVIMFFCWAIFTLVSYLLGYTQGAEEHYLMSLSAIAIFWLGQYAGISSRGPAFAWRLFLIIGLIFSVFAFFQHVLTPNTIFGIEKPYHRERLTGTFLSSNTAATFLGVIVLASAAQIYRDWRISFAKNHDSEVKVLLDMLQNSILSATTFLFAFVALLLTASRAGIAVVFCTSFLFFLWVVSQILFRKNAFGTLRIGPALLSSAGFVAILYLFWNMSGGMIADRYDTVFEDVTDRAHILKASWTSFKYQPWIGHGLGSLNEAKLLGVEPLIHQSVMAQNASHNFIAQNLVQVGLIGSCILALLYTYIITRIFLGATRGQRYRTYITAILFISFLVCVHGLFDYALEIPSVMLTHMWLLGLGYGIQLKYART